VVLSGVEEHAIKVSAKVKVLNPAKTPKLLGLNIIPPNKKKT